MEVVLKNVSCKRNQQKLEKVNITIPSNQIVGLIGEERTLLLEYLDGLLVGTGSITFDGKKRTRENWEKMKKVTGLVPREMLSDTMFSTVEEQMRFFIQCYHVPVKNLDKKIKDSLKIVGFNGAYLQKSIHDLSISERKLVQIAYCLLTNPSMILLDEPFVNLDVTNQKKMMMLFRLLKEKYHKTIVIASHDSNFLYENTQYTIILADHTCLKEGDTAMVFQDVPFLLEHQLEVPDLIYFTYKVREEKKVRLSYHKDIRDLIKDIYKHVS